ncbi:MAG: CCA tRNA nucleotidyltransferase [Cytophagales bacterium]|nr:CCA tRNA nucleotidyltransferase [Cytophagales bacterium]
MNYSSVLYRYPILQWVGKVADQHQLETYVIGGFVRDLLLKSVSKDIDIVCVGSGIQLAKAVARAIAKNTKVTVFKNFGTATLKWNDWEVEFVGARKESYRKDSRKPVVENGTLEDDQNRRDFTVNAIAICLNHDRFGELVDPFEGVKDLQKKTIQTPLAPAITFSDDPLRMIRAIRFASQLHFTIAPATLEAIQQHATRSNIVSKERIVDELHKIILSKVPSYGFRLLFDVGLLSLIFPELAALQGVETIEGQSHKDNFYHTLQVLDNVASVSTNLWLRWAALLHDIAKPLTKRFDSAVGFTFHGHEDLGPRMIPTIFRKMKLPLNEKMAYVQKLVRLHLRPIALVKDSVTDSAVRRLLYEAGDDLEDLMLLCRADITSNNPEKIKRYLQNFDKVEEKIREVEKKDQFRNFQPVITGDMIMQAFQLKPSRLVGEIKKAIREAILEGEVRNQEEEAYQYMLRVGKEKGLQPFTSLNETPDKNKTTKTSQSSHQ